MSKPEDIPQDVWEAAGTIINGAGNWREDLSRLILAERERCAKVLSDNHTIVRGDPADPMMPHLIDAIRNGAPA